MSRSWHLFAQSETLKNILNLSSWIRGQFHRIVLAKVWRNSNDIVRDQIYKLWISLTSSEITINPCRSSPWTQNVDTDWRKSHRRVILNHPRCKVYLWIHQQGTTSRKSFSIFQSHHVVIISTADNYCEWY